MENEIGSLLENHVILGLHEHYTMLNLFGKPPTYKIYFKFEPKVKYNYDD